LTEADLERDPDGLFGSDRIRNQGSKTECRNLMGVIVERYLGVTKAVGVTHQTIVSVQIAM
jgi:hypothetical protein